MIVCLINKIDILPDRLYMMVFCLKHYHLPKDIIKKIGMLLIERQRRRTSKIVKECKEQECEYLFVSARNGHQVEVLEVD